MVKVKYVFDSDPEIERVAGIAETKESPAKDINAWRAIIAAEMAKEHGVISLPQDFGYTILPARKLAKVDLYKDRA